jgi:alkylation response protein AidB-like acyl-CoA dehydrogenase
MTIPIPKLPRDFGFGEDHEVLRDSAQRFLAERCPMDEVRRLADDPLGYDPGLWKEIAGLGWTGLMVAEEHGGAGLGALHLALLLEEMGRVLLPSPFLAGALAGAALSAAGDARWLPGLASGDLLATLAFAEPDGSWEPGDVAATAEPSEGGFVLRGAKAYVPAAPSANLVVAPFREPNGAIALFAVELPAAGAVVEPETGVDPTRRSGRVIFEGARVGAKSRLPGDGVAALAATFRLGWTALAAEAVGAAEATLILTRDYAVDRAQFGRQIGWRAPARWLTGLRPPSTTPQALRRFRRAWPRPPPATPSTSPPTARFNSTGDTASPSTATCTTSSSVHSGSARRWAMRSTTAATWRTSCSVRLDAAPAVLIRP